jgi:hypothetical protein
MRLVALLSVIVVAGAISIGASARPGTGHGALHITKECSQYNGSAGSFCTITSSNVKAIRAGMRVVYLQPLGVGVLDSDIVLTSGHGSEAWGHVILDTSTGRGRVVLAGGTGKFHDFRAQAAVSVDAAGVWHWDGSYSFARDDEDD